MILPTEREAKCFPSNHGNASRKLGGEFEMNIVSVDGNKLIEAIGTNNAGTIVDVMMIDLRDSGHATLSDEVEWQCSVENKWWPIAGYQLNLTDEYAVRWTDTQEAGIDDITIIERIDDTQDQADLSAWLREIAAGCGSSNGCVR